MTSGARAGKNKRFRGNERHLCHAFPWILEHVREHDIWEKPAEPALTSRERTDASLLDYSKAPGS
jgi:hypothetical protein